ncbi:hypothetical protein [Candidatus Scalindua japonica]|nr:hypothetical protein [Candidatus Scalindua japonica]
MVKRAITTQSVDKGGATSYTEEEEKMLLLGAANLFDYVKKLIH